MPITSSNANASGRPLVRVVKVGGSLLEWEALPRALDAWLAAEPAAANILVCGSGPLGDVIRAADRRFGLGEERSHWLAIDVLAVSARLLAAIVADAPLIASYDSLAAQAKTGRPQRLVFDPRDFLLAHEASLPAPLPHGWHVTTDSIAAQLALALAADELALLKSHDPPAGSLDQLAAAGFVDAHFPRAAAGVARTRLINLRRPAGAPPSG